MFAICNSSRIFSRRAFSSGVRFFLAICKTSNVVLLFYTTSEVYTKFGMVSITKNKLSFTNDDSLRRMLYLASQRIVKHWHARYQNWDLVLSQLEIMFADRAVG